jgi:SAM-dependent methyltransferase
MSTARWTEVTGDPNSAAATRFRAAQLQAAWTPEIHATRIDALVGYAQGKRVLDIGCVDHDVLAQKKAKGDVATRAWLHARVTSSAATCLGLDYDEAGVEAMNALGYPAVHHDITLGPGAVAKDGSFEAVIAGEVIEHLSHVQALFDFAHGVLEPGGTLAISTPNPYAPWRVRAGQKRYIWESVDHVTYLFPSGIAELADRAGLVLRNAYTVEYPGLRDSVATLSRALRRRLRGQTGRVGLRAFDLALPVKYVTPLEWCALAGRRRSGWLGEYAIYALGRP